MTLADVIIIGAGPGGLVAATYLARFNRNVIVIDNGQSRSQLIGRSHNYPTYTEGISGEDILSRLRAQAERYGAIFVDAQVTSITQMGDGFTAIAGQLQYSTNAVILATGIGDILPTIEGIKVAILEGRVAVCPVCHAYESNGKSIAILTRGPRGIKEASTMKRYAKTVTVLDLGQADLSSMIQDRSIAYYQVTEADMTVNPNVTCRLPNGELQTFDQLYCALGRTPHNELALSLGAECSLEGCLLVDEYQETSVHNLFAIGDVVKGLDQMVVAEAEAAIATCHLNTRL